MPLQASVGPIQGSVFGGHAPIVDAHIFLLEATATGTSTTGYATMAKSLLSASSTGTSHTYPVTEDVTTGSVTKGLYYVTSDATGSFNVSGDYTCDIGDPVYMYASSGSPSSVIDINITGISETLSGSSYTYTFTASNVLYAGQTLLFSGSSLGGEWAALNGTTQTVLSTPTSTSFKIETSIAPTTGANTQTGTVASIGYANPAIVNLVMLGVCPSAGNFSYLHYVYINEVSTVAMAYAMAPFATDALHIGSSASNVIGLENAAINASNLYNIQGAPLGTQAAGEGQVANAITVAGNGTVPRAELNTLADIIAACIDSTNIATSASAACTTLFADATSTGTTSGTKPIDTATAVINIALNPGTPDVVSLFSLATSTSPFTPLLTTKPKDFTVAITYNNIATPGSIAIDSAGDAYVPTNSSSGYVTKLSPAGAVLNTSATGGSGFNSIAIGPSGNVFVTAGASNAVYDYTSSLGAVTGSPWTSTPLSTPTSLAIDTNGYVYVTDGGNSHTIIRKFNASGSLNTSITNSCLQGVTQIALDSSDYIWTTSASMQAGCRLSNPGASAAWYLSSYLVDPGNFAIDSLGNGWSPLAGGSSLGQITPSGTGTVYGSSGVGGLSSPTWVAIDGGGNVWATNTGNSYALSEFTNTGNAITGSAGYQAGNLNAPTSIAIDASGDVWIPNHGGNTVTEIIGVANPVVTPLSALMPGVQP